MKRLRNILRGGILGLLLCFAFIVQAQITADNVLRTLVNDQIKNQQAELRNGFDVLVAEDGVENNAFNFRQYAYVQVMHNLFTAEGPVNGSSLTGDMPYIWHWVEPNPRNFIILKGTYIEDIPYEGYKSFAMADRVPNIFLTDFFSDNKYTHPLIGSFSTFGWCSEREMSYATVMESLGFNTNIVSLGSHTWSNVSVHFQKGGDAVTFVAGVDNTYNSTVWGLQIPQVSGKNRLEDWYNLQVDKSVNLIKNTYVSPGRTQEIYSLLR